MSQDDEDDAALAARALRGDERAFARLARRHGPRLARTVRALGVPASDVEDVVQQALLAAWRALAGYDTERPFAAWASVVAANKARDWRRQARRRAWLKPQDLERSEAAAVPDLLAAAEPDARAELRRVEAALDTLADHLRTPLVLVSAGGFTQAEVAAALGISAKAVELRIARARRRLELALAARA